MEIVTKTGWFGWQLCFPSSHKPIYRQGSLDIANCWNGRRKNEQCTEKKEKIFHAQSMSILPLECAQEINLFNYHCL